MICTRVLRAQQQLQSHRLWLTSFVARTRRDSTSPHPVQRPSIFQHGHARFVQHKATIRKAKSPLIHRKLKISKEDRRLDESQAALQEIRQAAQDGDIARVTQLYASLRDKSVVQPTDFRLVTVALQNCLVEQQRSTDAETKRERIEQLVAFAEQLTADVMGGKLNPDITAHGRLIRFFNISGTRDTGVRFWQWLEQQDDLHVNPTVYGVAIELLAVNGAPLAELETLYVQALERFPGTFSAYHLSPEAIVSNRNQRTTLRAIPMLLFRGILIARLLRGDAQNAYLALDTALRLYPDHVPANFFLVFFEERPILEAYTVFAIACRGGIVLPINHFRQLLGNLRTGSDLSSPTRHALAVRSMLSATYMYLGSGGQITSNALSELIIAITQFLRVKGVFNLEAQQKQDIVVPVMDVIRSLFVVTARYGVRPSLSAFNSIITNLGGTGQSRKIIDVALADMQRLGLQPNEVTRRSILTAAGLLGDDEYVREAWQDLVRARADAGQYPDATDLLVLIKNASLTGQLEFAASEFRQFKSVVPEKDHFSLEEFLQGPSVESDMTSTTDILDSTMLTGEIQNVANDVLIMNRKTHNSPTAQDFSNQPLPMTLLPYTRGTSLPENEQRAVYDSLTAEPSQPQEDITIEDGKDTLDPAFDIENSSYKAIQESGDQPTIEDGAAIDTSKSPANSPTGLSLGKLRYENWKTINYLLELANNTDKAYLKIVDDAIAAGIVPPQRTLGLTLDTHETLRSYGLSDALKVAEELKQECGELDDVQIQDRKNEILRLRGRLS